MANILIIGSGGREHAFAWKIKQSPLCEKLYIAPGNAGTALVGENVFIETTNFIGLKEFALEKKIDTILVGPEDPLVKGIYDFFSADESVNHIQIIGPNAAAAQLEGSKAFAKAFMKKYGIPTADYKEFDENSFEKGIQYLQQHSLPIVLKADGLAAGKGVLICNSHAEALHEFEQILQYNKFGYAGSKVVVEAFLKGIEMSVFVITNGEEYCLLPEAKDYKRIGEGDTGLNTGGMGAVSPVPFFNEGLKEKVIKKIIEPTMKGIQNEKMIYNGFIFLGLMVYDEEPYVIEYNCRMGDPETEVVLPRIQNDLLDIFQAMKEKSLKNIKISTHPKVATTTMIVSGGYPNQYQVGKEIYGLDTIQDTNSLIFHAGTTVKNGMITTNGGRVLTVTSFGANVTEASKNSLSIIDRIKFEGMNYRKDIGYEFT